MSPKITEEREKREREREREKRLPAVFSFYSVDFRLFNDQRKTRPRRPGFQKSR